MSQPKIYVGNLSYDVSSDDLNELFGQFGAIDEVKIITDKETGRSKGFGFVTFSSSDDANEAVSLNGTEFSGRQIRVSPAKENSRGSGGGGGGRGGRGGGRGGYGGGGRGGNHGGGNHGDRY